MPKAPSQTDFAGSSTGVFHTGTGNVNLIVSNLGDAIDIMRKFLPAGQISPIDNLITALQELRKEQKIVSELKQIHNMLHELETPLDVLGKSILLQKKSKNFRSIQDHWRTIKPRFLALEWFASNDMTHLNDPRLERTDGKMIGPMWVTQLILLQSDFEVSLKEQNIIVIYDLSQTMLDTCREQLFRIDRRLLEAVNQLDQFSEEILRIIKDGKPKS